IWIDEIVPSVDGTDKSWAKVRVVIKGQETQAYILASLLNIMTEEDSGLYQSSLDQPMPTKEKPTTPTDPVTPTKVPTEKPTTPTDFNEYKGYALTNQKTALLSGYTNVGVNDVLGHIEANVLVKIEQQKADEKGKIWSYINVATINQNNQKSGWVDNSDLKYLTNEEAKPYVDKDKEDNTIVTQPPVTEPEPPQKTGFYRIIPDDTPLRQAPGEGYIDAFLAANTIVYVNGQDYNFAKPEGDWSNLTKVWHFVRVESTGQKGYVRGDMITPMTEKEIDDYLKDKNATEPPVITPPPVNPDSMSSYGYVTSNSVNFRKSAGTNTTKIGEIKQYGMALILGTEVIGSEQWYKIRYNGLEGYVSGTYFKQMTLSESKSWIGSSQYLQGIQNNATSGGSGNANPNAPVNTGRPVSPEDWTIGNWVNPNAGATYAPFDPYATPGALGTFIPIESLSPSASVSPSPSVNPFATFPPAELPDNTEEGSFPTGLVVAGVLLLLGGGGLYGYSVYRSSKKKAAAKAAQQRRAQGGAQPPNARPHARSGGIAPPPPGGTKGSTTQSGQKPTSGSASVPRQTLPPQPGIRPGAPNTGATPPQQRPGQPPIPPSGRPTPPGGVPLTGTTKPTPPGSSSGQNLQGNQRNQGNQGNRPVAPSNHANSPYAPPRSTGGVGSTGNSPAGTSPTAPKPNDPTKIIPPQGNIGTSPSSSQGAGPSPGTPLGAATAASAFSTQPLSPVAGTTQPQEKQEEVDKKTEVGSPSERMDGATKPVPPLSEEKKENASPNVKPASATEDMTEKTETIKKESPTPPSPPDQKIEKSLSEESPKSTEESSDKTPEPSSSANDSDPSSPRRQPRSLRHQRPNEETNPPEEEL
ncbi:MAG: SH3 domain-containing protein, partial [Clostridiales bacterium]|nr:SH3 domain-containing protein [Clostridiales bacterium]